MRALRSADLLELWETGLARPRWQWAAEVLETAYSELKGGAFDRLTVGERDRRLFIVRETIFGPILPARSSCPSCGERVELILNSADLIVAAPEDFPGEATLSHDGWDIQFRVPTAGDVAATQALSDVAAMREALLDRCIVAARQGDVAVAATSLPEKVVARVIDCMARADPQAEINLAMNCPACGREWLAAFDILSYFWSELDAWAKRLLQEVHHLASAYGWTESNVLALSPQRRARYSEMIGS